MARARVTTDYMSIFVRYNEPIVVAKHLDKKTAQADLELRAQRNETGDELQDVLNTIFPPQLWEEDGQLWEQSVSTGATAVEDLDEMRDALEKRLKLSQARETGVCPIRREIFTQLFDEAIRQVTINCTERGLLLLRVRDELKRSMELFENLYGSSLSFGMRKAVLEDEDNKALSASIKSLEMDKIALQAICDDVTAESNEWARIHAERRGSEYLKYSEEMAMLKRTNAQLKAQLENIIAPKK